MLNGRLWRNQLIFHQFSLCFLTVFFLTLTMTGCQSGIQTNSLTPLSINNAKDAQKLGKLSEDWAAAARWSPDGKLLIVAGISNVNLYEATNLSSPKVLTNAGLVMMV
jgi:hypothetical protein